jgi:hypothetical protein
MNAATAGAFRTSRTSRTPILILVDANIFILSALTDSSREQFGCRRDNRMSTAAEFQASTATQFQACFVGRPPRAKRACNSAVALRCAPAFRFYLQ